MSEHHQGRRVRVITDEAKYRRHRRAKMLRKLARVAFWALVIALGVLLFWLVLDKLLQPPPQE